VKGVDNQRLLETPLSNLKNPMEKEPDMSSRAKMSETPQDAEKEGRSG
jgi:hypothetical protein